MDLLEDVGISSRKQVDIPYAEVSIFVDIVCTGFIHLIGTPVSLRFKALLGIMQILK